MSKRNCRRFPSSSGRQGSFLSTGKTMPLGRWARGCWPRKAFPPSPNIRGYGPSPSPRLETDKGFFSPGSIGLNGGSASRPLTPLRVYIPCMSGGPSSKRADCALAADANKTIAIRLFERRILISLLLKVEDTFVLEQFHAFLQSAIQRHAHFPGSREYLRILDRGLIKDVIPVCHSV